jgi:hypothetical protein
MLFSKQSRKPFIELDCFVVHFHGWFIISLLSCSPWLHRLISDLSGGNLLLRIIMVCKKSSKSSKRDVASLAGKYVHGNKTSSPYLWNFAEALLDFIQILVDIGIGRLGQSTKNQKYPTNAGTSGCIKEQTLTSKLGWKSIV